MRKIEILQGLISAIDRKIKSLMLQSELSLRTYEDSLPIDEDSARLADNSLIALAHEITRLEQERQILVEMLRREETRF